MLSPSHTEELIEFSIKFKQAFENFKLALNSLNDKDYFSPIDYINGTEAKEQLAKEKTDKEFEAVVQIAVEELRNSSNKEAVLQLIRKYITETVIDMPSKEEDRTSDSFPIVLFLESKLFKAVILKLLERE